MFASNTIPNNGFEKNEPKIVFRFIEFGNLFEFRRKV